MSLALEAIEVMSRSDSAGRLRELDRPVFFISVGLHVLTGIQN